MVVNSSLDILKIILVVLISLSMIKSTRIYSYKISKMNLALKENILARIININYHFKKS